MRLLLTDVFVTVESCEMTASEEKMNATKKLCFLWQVKKWNERLALFLRVELRHCPKTGIMKNKNTVHLLFPEKDEKSITFQKMSGTTLIKLEPLNRNIYGCCNSKQGQYLAQWKF
jgi:hypothetical protein